MIKALTKLSRKELIKLEKNNICKFSFTELKDFVLTINGNILTDEIYSKWLDDSNISFFELLLISELQIINSDDELKVFKLKIKALNQRAVRMVNKNKKGWFK